MSCYARDDEERIRMQAQVRAWGRAGLLDADQVSALDTRLRTPLRRTNGFLRAALALFSALIIGAAVLLAFVSLNISGDAATTITLVIAAIVCGALAEYLIASFRVYRYGVEEALVVAAALLIVIAFDLEARALALPHHRLLTTLVGAASGFAVYRRFGLVYAAVAAMICAAFIPFSLEVGEVGQRMTAAVILGAALAWARVLLRRHRDDVPGDDYEILQAAAYAGIYVSLNLHLFGGIGGASPVPVAAWFYWTTYAVTWLLPVAGLTAAIRDKDRSLLAVTLASALATLVTNQPYLGWARQTWDPILLGVVLLAVGTVLRRWLASGRNGHRGGFTADRILESDSDVLRAVATASAAWPPFESQASARVEQPSSQFQGGRSGGAGGGAAY